MGIVFHRVRILQPPTNTVRACNGGIFNLDVEVHGTTDGAGGRYQVQLWDDDLFLDDYLENAVVPPVAPNANFTIVTPMQLTCDQDCEVVGAIGSSGESTAEIYAYATEQVPIGGATMASAPINLICDGDCKEFGEKDESGASEEYVDISEQVQQKA